tara:strand:- start:679 stop:1038 length:360 start_codon:yes stop_codon:yes gene_type:complete
MKNYNDFIQEAVAVPETVKALKKRFKGTKDVKKSSTKKQLPGSKVGSVIVPKAQPSQIRDYLISLGYKVEEEFDGFIDMYCVYRKINVIYKATIVSNDLSKDVEVRLSSHARGKKGIIY